jgi:putative ABC transport system permease protein
MLLLGILAAVALVLAAIGVHGVLSYGVSQRTREIGIRVALGARPKAVRQRVILEGVLVAAGGLALGLAAAYALARVFRNLLFDVTPGDPATFVGVAAFLATVAVAASYLPARRAVRVDPVIALRAE